MCIDSSLGSSTGQLRDVAVCKLLHFGQPLLMSLCALRRELAGQKALLRLQRYFADAPAACGGNAALHLTNFALHAVAARSARQADPRMRSLSSVERLQVRAAPCRQDG